ncbi:hypothetical protein GCM10025879_11850 [Leuconostoc litchii]|uniref:GTP-binding protein n=1 Tax=Leuconostoc litchii TaxID=1981069 RepID=A0A6P2CMR0_9LACO|nr:GTP-binding protein [Leuconostoc litchii]TYC46235.1 GTP-binding protein [Leuconostoc litchii]GMA69939.1 hypothetical protein GCM10025879_11850 [Leuconostoc litchii]
MSIFNIFKKNKKTEQIIVSKNEPITWETTTNVNDFFEGYNKAIQAAESQGEIAAAETLRANKSTIQLAFIDRFEQDINAKATKISDVDERITLIINAISEVRKFNLEMPINVRTRLAQAKKNLIGE